jgi:hypothetical protein
MTTTRHRRLGSLIASGVVAVAAMTSLAPAANAQTEQQIKAGCKAAGGTYKTRIDEGGNTSTCCYKDYYGDRYCDIYLDGNYVGDYNPDKGAPPVGVKPPIDNPPVGAPPITNPPPAA